MKKKNLFYTLAASVMLAATAGLTAACTSNDDNPVSPSDNNKWGAAQLEFDLGTTKIGAKFVEGGTYSMLYERDGETKTVTGTLSDYYIAPVELSNRVWAAVMGSKPEGQTNDGDMYPVTMVNYYDIAGPGGFLEKLNTMLKDQLPAGKKFALPTEAQWQYAAMGGKQSKGYKYSGSNTLDDVAWYKDNAGGTTHPIGQKQGNELELHDMTGNVWEWIRDRFVFFDELPASQGTDYVCQAESPYCVHRGGCYLSPEESQAMSFRDWLPMNSRYDNIGLRLVLTDAFEQENLVEPIQPEKAFQMSAMGEYGLTLALTLVEVKGGTYSMQYERDGVTKTVTGTLSDYYIGQYEVDNDMWYAVMGTKPEGQTKSGGFYPVSNVSYEEITKPGGFLDKANALLADQLPKGMKLMLPTEAQWHYAAMGGQKSKGYTYAGSNTLADVAWYADNADGTTHPVASKQPNELGLYDMSGNVRELTSRSLNDGKIIVFGGDWTSDAQSCNVKLSIFDASATASESLGFRLVLADVPQPEAIDLGLPSSTKWANMNVGASKPEDYGLYFAWGETVGYSSDTGDGHRFDWENYKWYNGSGKTLTKYCTTSDYGTVDNKMVLDLDDDAAYVNWGDKWRMPSVTEMEELVRNCTWTWQAEGNTEYNGVVGYKVTGTNGNSIFLPAAGYRYDMDLDGEGTYGRYWTASLDDGSYHLDEGYSNHAYNMFFQSSWAMYDNRNRRFFGYSIRPVLRN
jgi:formylglycine-generating enzyme required for sulfatase activity